MNSLVFGGLIASAFIVLFRRRFQWSTLFYRNKALITIYSYLLLTSLWSEFPVGSFERVLKDFGTVLVILVVLTEKDPFASARIVLVRSSFVIFPLSICFIRYYPTIGRMMSKSSELMYNGVATHKNTLGADAMVLLLGIAVEVIDLRSWPKNRSSIVGLRLRYAMVVMGAWLLWICNSKTSLVCTLLGLAILCAGKRIARISHPGRLIMGAVAVLGVGAFLNSAFNIDQVIFKVLGRNETFTGREDLWRMIAEQHINPIIGDGFLSFWNSPIAVAYREAGGTSVVSTHNGYLEVFLDGGGLGVLLLLVLLVSALRRITKGMPDGGLSAVARLMFCVPILIYNWTESTYFRLGPVWFVLLLVIIDY